MLHMMNIRKILIFLSVTLSYTAQGSGKTYALEEKWVSCGKDVQLLDPYYAPGETFTWDGPVKDGKAHGHGVATKYVNGQFESKYEGTYRQGVREGKGTIQHPCRQSRPSLQLLRDPYPLMESMENY